MQASFFFLFHSLTTYIPVSVVSEAVQEQCNDSKLEMAVHFLVSSLLCVHIPVLGAVCHSVVNSSFIMHTKWSISWLINSINLNFHSHGYQFSISMATKDSSPCH